MGVKSQGGIDMEKSIKHIFCGGIAALKSKDLKIKNAKITLTNTHHYKCSKCGEEFSTSEQMHELDRKLKMEMKQMVKA